MKLINELEELIEDEIEDVKKYAQMAAEVKDEYPTLAHTLYTISTQEDAHQSMIHNEVVKIIEDYRRKNGEPPAAMMAVYDYLHKKHIEKMAEARLFQEEYQNR